jgi:cell division protein FtsL
MAQQKGHLKLTGTIGDVTYYHWDGRYLARKKSSLDAARIKEDPAFNNLRKEATIMSQASPIASMVYHQLKGKKEKLHYRKLTGQAQRLLRQGVTVSKIKDLLFDYAAREWGLVK